MVNLPAVIGGFLGLYLYKRQRSWGQNTVLVESQNFINLLDLRQYVLEKSGRKYAVLNLQDYN